MTWLSWIYWKKWGADVDLTGTLPEQHGERNNPATGKAHDEIPATLKPEFLLKDADYLGYDLIYFPGGEGVAEFLKENRSLLEQIIDGAVKNQISVAAICHAPYILSASKLLSGHSVSVQGNEFKPELIKSGAKIVSDIFVSDGYYLTGQWPYFETFAVSVAERLVYPEGNGPLQIAKKNSNPVINKYLEQRNTFLMKPGIIPDDTIKLMIKHAVNPLLPLGMFNNSSIRFIAVKDSSVKSTLVDQLVESAVNKNKEENIPVAAIKRLWTMIFNAPVIIFVYNDLTEIESTEDIKDKNNLLRIITVLAGQSVSQLGSVANELGYRMSVIGSLRSLAAEDGFKKVLDVPSNYQLVNILGIGHPVEMTNPAVARPVGEYLIIK